VHSEELYGTLQILADEYKGKVRFGMVDCVEEEFLKLTFGVLTVP
jgi:thioredoxin-like negative regulator of GroEL